MTSRKGQTEKKGREPTASTPPNDKAASATANVVRETLFVIFFVRLINAYCVRTFFQPDEYFQALEPAWQMVYGDNGGAWITWEWRYALRSSIHPTIFALGYFIVDNFWGSINVPLAKAKWLLLAPKVLQTGVATLSDWYTWRLAEKLYGARSAAAWSTLLVALLNPWQWYTATRTFSNCLETTLTAMALYYWPWELLGVEVGTTDSSGSSSALLSSPSKWSSLRNSFLLAAFAVLLRPTNVFVWLSLGTLIVTRFTLTGESPLTRGTLLAVLWRAIVFGSLALGASLLLDYSYFGEWTFPPFEWLYYNVKVDLAKFYGQNDWHYFLSQGIPLLSTTITPFVLQGLYKSLDAESTHPVTTANALKALSFIVVTTISTLSFVSHKEVRFIQPLLPALHILAAPHVTSFFTSLSRATAATTGPIPDFTWKKKPLLAGAILVNVVIGGYLSWFHSRGPIQVTSFLRSEFERIHPSYLTITPNTTGVSPNTLRPPQELFALFLTPCHATPWRSHLIYPDLHARALTCEPPLDTAPNSPERAAYMDETRLFYADPMGFMANTLWPRDYAGEDMARYIVGYEGLAPALEEYFAPDGPGGRHKIRLTEAWRSDWNGFFTDDERKSGRVVVWATGFYD